MHERKTDPANAEHDAVMSWLQDREMKDRQLTQARGGSGGLAFISTVIHRMQEKAHLAFPNIERNTIDTFVRRYVAPRG